MSQTTKQSQRHGGQPMSASAEASAAQHSNNVAHTHSGQHHYMNLSNQQAAPHGGRRLIVFRHGERVDFTFNTQNQNWTLRAFDERGRYRRFDANMSKSLPPRSGGAHAYANDTPLTEIGYLQAKLCGRALKDAGIVPDFIYTSCAFRCVQTSVGLLKGMGNTSVRLRVEPGLFEWGIWVRGRRPQWLSAAEFASIGYPIDVGYNEACSVSAVSDDETLTGYYDRSFNTVRAILDNHPEDCNIVLVAHGASLETCTRQLTGAPPRAANDFFKILHHTPYLASCQACEAVGGGWRLAEQAPVLPLTHQKNYGYRGNLLTLDDLNQLPA